MVELAFKTREIDGKPSAAGFVVRKCWIHSDFQRILINGAPGGLINNNYFHAGRGFPITTGNVDGLAIRDNEIEMTAIRQDGSDGNWVDVQDCANVSIRQNCLSSQ